jgi:phospholipid-binding lipoprotein MlaA
VNTRANYLGASDLLEQAALDKYSFVRDAYLQQRRNRLGQDKDTLPQYEEPEEGKPAEAVPGATPVPPPPQPPSS